MDRLNEIWDLALSPTIRVKLPEHDFSKCLDAFLNVALENFSLLHLRADQSAGLIQLFMRELRAKSLDFQSSKDSKNLRQFLQGRGFKFLLILNEITNKNPATVWWDMYVADFLIQLYQIYCTFENDKETNEISSFAAHCKNQLKSTLDFKSLVELCSKFQTLYVKKRVKKKKKRRRNERKSFGGAKFPQDSSTGVVGEDLHVLELAAESDQGWSSNESSSGVQDFGMRPFPPNPLDFEYFESTYRSDDEAKAIIDWRKKRQVRVNDFLLTTGEEASVDRNGQVSLTDSKKLVLTLLGQICHLEIEKRNLKMATELSIKLLEFGQEMICQLSEEEDMWNLEDFKFLKLTLAKLMLTSSFELILHEDFHSQLEKYQVVGYFLSALGGVLDTKKDIHHENMELAFRGFTALLIFLNRSEFLHSSMYKKKEENTKSVQEMLESGGGFVMAKKLTSLTAYIAKENILSGPEIWLLYENLAQLFTNFKFEILPLKSLHSALMKSFCDLLKKKLLISSVESKILGRDLLMICKIQSNLEFHTRWEMILTIISDATQEEQDVELLPVLLYVIENLVASCQNEETFQKKLPLDFSKKSSLCDCDYDSAFSDGSTERNSSDLKTSRHSPFGRIWKIYLELLQATNVKLAYKICKHLTKIVRNSKWNMRYDMFCKVFEPFLDYQTAMSSNSLTGSKIVLEILYVLPALLRNNQILQVFMKRKMHSLIINLTSFPELEVAAHEVLRSYITLEISNVLTQPNSKRPYIPEISSFDDSDGQLTEEDAFQPNFLNALNLTTIVKEFFDLLLNVTGKASRKMSKGQILNRHEFHSLNQVWRTQRVLFLNFRECADYAINRDLFKLISVLFSQLSTLIVAEKSEPYFYPIADCLGNMVAIVLAQFREETNFSDVGAIFEGVNKLIENAHKITKTENQRYLLSTIMKSNERRRLPVAEDFWTSIQKEKTLAELNSDGYEADENEDCGSTTSQESRKLVGKFKAYPTLKSDVVSTVMYQHALNLCICLSTNGHHSSDEVTEYFAHCLTSQCRRNSELRKSLQASNFIEKIFRCAKQLTPQTLVAKEELANLVVILAEGYLSSSHVKQIVSQCKDDNDVQLAKFFTRCLQRVVQQHCNSVSGKSKPSNYIGLPMAQSVDFKVNHNLEKILTSNGLFISLWINTSDFSSDEKIKVVDLNGEQFQIQVSKSLCILSISNEEQIECVLPSKTWALVVVSLAMMTPQKEIEIDLLVNGIRMSHRTTVCSEHVAFLHNQFSIRIGEDSNKKGPSFSAVHLGPFAILHVKSNKISSLESQAKYFYECGPDELSANSLRACESEISLLPIAYFNPKRPSELLVFTAENASAKSPKFFKPIPEQQKQMHFKVTQGETSGTFKVHHSNLTESIMISGGVSVLILLVLRAIEMELDDEDVANSLDILFSIVQYNSIAREDFERISGAEILTFALTNQKCQFGIKAVNTLLTHATTFPSLDLASVEKMTKFSEVPTHQLIFAQPVSMLIGLWSSMKKPLPAELEKSLGCRTLVGVVLKYFVMVLNNVNSAQNIRFFKENNFAGKMAFNLMEDLSFSVTVSESRSDLNEEICFLIEIYQALLGSPVDLDVLKEIMNLIILFYDPKLTFASHSRSSFYFNFGSFSGQRKNSLFSDTNSIASSSSENNLNNLLQNGIGTNSNTPNSRVMDIDAKQMRNALNRIQDKRHRSNGKIISDTSMSEVGDIIIEACPLPSDQFETEERQIVINSPIDDATSYEEYLSEIFISGLLNLVEGSLLNIADRDIAHVLNDIVLIEHIIVLCNSNCNLVRESVVRLFWQYVSRSSTTDNYNYQLQKLNGYFLIANQLHLQPITEKIVDACLSVVHNRRFRLEDSVEIPTHTEVQLRSSGMILLLAVLPNVVHDIPLAHGLVVHIHEIVSKCPTMLRNLYPLGLFEVVGKTLISLMDSEPVGSGIIGQDSREIVFDDLIDFLRCISIKLACAKGTESEASFTELIHILFGIAIKRSKNNLSIDMLVKAVCAVIDECLSEIQSKLLTFDQPVVVVSKPKNIYGGLYPVEEMTDMLMRNETPRESLTSNDSTMTSFQVGQLFSEKHSKSASRGELIDRIASIIDLALEIVSFWSIPDPSQDDEAKGLAKLGLSLFSLLLNELIQRFEHAKSKSIFPNLQKLRRRFITLLNYILMPSNSLEFRVNILVLLKNHTKNHDFVRYVFENNLQMLSKTLTLLKSLMFIEKNQNAVEEIEMLYKHLVNDKILETEDEDTINFDLDKIKFEKEVTNQKFEASQTKLENGLKFSDLSTKIAEFAVKVTKSTMSDQNAERKKFMLYLRTDISVKIRVQNELEKMVSRQTHERGIWHFKQKYPPSWCLSKFEGPDRVRVRMERCFSQISSGHYKENEKYKAEFRNIPFASLFQDKSNLAVVIIDQLNSKDAILLMEKVQLVLPDEQIEGDLLLSRTKLYFVSEGKNILSLALKLENLRDVYKRWFQLEDRALELFFGFNPSRFFVLGDRKRRNLFLKSLIELHPPLTKTPSTDAILEMWRDGQITNFDYLSFLNKLAGRSYNDLMQYPIFPFILAQYDSNSLNLFDSESYRNLQKPIAIQNPKKEKRFLENYKALAEEAKCTTDHMEPFHYGSHYSNTGVCLHYLTRLLPFTRMFLRYQDGNFDLPDRSFHSMSKTWALASGDSTTDVKELIPEMFCLPEMFMNAEGFNLGLKQNGDGVDNVVLPPWANNDSRLFVKIHRQALETNFVHEHLSHWIDLVFGYKQTGKEAVASVNVFHPSTYYGFDLTTIEDAVLREARATMIRTYGQTPKQLFKRQHPLPNKSWTDESSSREMKSIPRVLDSVIGLKWGTYCGSPSEAKPAVVWRGFQDRLVPNFVALPNGDVFGIPSGGALLVKFQSNADGNIRLAKRSGFLGAALLTHNHRDTVINAKIRKNVNSRKFVDSSSNESLDIIATHSENVAIWLAFESGRIEVHSCDFDPKILKLCSVEPVSLFAHLLPITCLDICHEFGIAVSGSQDGTCVIWDANSLDYIRSLQFDLPVDKIAVSKTCGEIAVATSHPSSQSSQIALFTVNGDKTCCDTNVEPKVTSLTFSFMPEGISCNVVVTGHSNGTIRMWNSWNLSPVRDISTQQTSPIIALQYNYNNQNLYASTSAREVIIFEKEDVRGIGKSPRFVDLNCM